MKMGQTAQDGDGDVVISHFDASDTGLTPDDTEVCIIGKFGDRATGEEREFFDCDLAILSP